MEKLTESLMAWKKKKKCAAIIGILIQKLMSSETYFMH